MSEGAPSTASGLVSVIIPCFNYGRFLGAAVDSALAQTYQPVEVIVVDDGSTDSTAAVAESYGERVRYIRKVNGGLSSARNAGVDVCRGVYVVSLDADDLLDRTFVADTVAALAAHPEVSFVYTQLEFFGRISGVTRHPFFDPQLLLQDNYINATSMLRRRVFDRIRYNESLRAGWEDWDFYLTLVEQGHKGLLLDRPLVRYRKHDSPTSMSDTISRDPSRLMMRARVLRNHPALCSPPLRWRLIATVGAKALLRKLRRMIPGDAMRPDSVVR